MFAKIFECEKHGQLLVKKDIDENDCPEVRIFGSPPGMDICSLALIFTDDEEGYKLRDIQFEEMDLEKVEFMVVDMFRHFS